MPPATGAAGASSPPRTRRDEGAAARWGPDFFKRWQRPDPERVRPLPHFRLRQRPETASLTLPAGHFLPPSTATFSIGASDICLVGVRRVDDAMTSRTPLSKIVQESMVHRRPNKCCLQDYPMDRPAIVAKSMKSHNRRVRNCWARAAGLEWASLGKARAFFTAFAT